LTLVDTNVLLDLVTDDPIWAEWSVFQLDTASLLGPLLINDVIYAELSVRYEAIEALDEFVAEAALEMTPVPREALFLAAKVFANYRRAGGTKTGVLPDFFIGAHAAVSRIPVLTRNIGRYRTYFPTITLISPENRP
jgi:predicted nucleic acid-binding protein